MMNYLWPVWTMLAAALAPCEEAPLCKCGINTVAVQLASSEAVFTGVVLRVGEPSGHLERGPLRTWTDSTGMPVVTASATWVSDGSVPVTLLVDRAWKGAAHGDSVTVTDFSMCGVDFTPGQQYLVYAGRRENGTLGTSPCERTRWLQGVATILLPSAEDDMRELDAIARRPDS